MAHDPAVLLELVGVSKSFGGVEALRDVNFSLRAGEIHGLVGENGAGKSTTMKIIAGVHTEYSGTYMIDGREVRLRSARDALAAGIAMVHQELSIAPDLTVAENVFLGHQPTNRFGVVRWRHMARAASEQLTSLGIDVDPNQRIGDLPIGLQQLIEIARVLFSGARMIILDEPTSALSPPEVDRLFSVLRRMRDSGRSIVFISHFLDDVLRVSDTVTVFRNGRMVLTSPAHSITKSGLIERMIGSGHEDLEVSYTSNIALNSHAGAPVIFEADGLSLARAYQNVSLQVHAGEVLGIYGFMGCGQVPLSRTLFGKIKPDRGTLRVNGLSVAVRSTASARKAGIAFVPESRRSMLFHMEPVYKNMSISILDRISAIFLKPTTERRFAREHVARLQIRPRSSTFS